MFIDSTQLYVSQIAYHTLVPDPLEPSIHVPAMPNMPFEPFHFAPIFAADECSFWALSNVVCWQQADIDNICNADFPTE